MTSSRSTAGMIFNFGSRRAHWKSWRASAAASVVAASPAAMLMGALDALAVLPEISGSTASASSAPISIAAGDAATTDAAALARQLFQWARRDPKLKIIPAVERELVIQALKETNNNQVHAAKMLGITRATLRKR